MLKLVAEPSHAGPVFAAIGVTVRAFITTFIFEAGDVPQLAVVAVTLYMPALAAVTLLIIGF